MKVNLYLTTILLLFFIIHMESLGSELKSDVLTVIVTDQQGQALSNVRITEYVTGREYTTDDNGRFICDISDEKRYFFAVDKNRKLAEASKLDTGQKQLQIRLAPAKIVSGQVVDTEGKPIPGTRITALPMTWFYVLTDNQGKFDIGWPEEWEPEENLCLFARNIGRNLASVTDIYRQSENVTIELTEALTLAGSIENSQGMPITGARVRLNLLKGWNAITFVEDVLTDNKGYFEIHALPQKQEYSISASYNNHLPAQITIGAINRITDYQELDPIILKAPNIPRETGEATGTLTINVTDEYGKGMDDIYLMLWTQYEDGSGRGFTYPVVPLVKAGLYEIRDIKAGHFHAITIDKNEYVRFKKYDIEVEQENNPLITCILSKGGIVEGQVTDELNNPVEEVPIVVNSLVTRVDCITDKNGHFMARHVPNISCTVITEVKPESIFEIATMRDIFPGQRDIHLVLKKKENDRIFTSLVGQNIREITELNISLDINQIQNKMILLCFFDYQQRPSRNSILQLSEEAQKLADKDIVIVAIQASKIEQDTLDKWLKEQNITFPIGMISENEKGIQFNWGIKSLPWLILTDKNHIVTTEGFSINELDEKIMTLRE